MENKNEIWKEINEHHKYSISNFGRLKNNKTGHILNLRIKNGYVFAGVSCSHRVKKWLSVHRLVAKAFLPNPMYKPEVNHIDGNKLNNSLNNLEWVTKLENMHHSIRTGLHNPKMISAKTVCMFNLNGVFIKQFVSAREASRSMNINTIHQACKQNDNRKQAGGYIWRYRETILPVPLSYYGR
jgi:hypothetical protein